MKLQINKKTSPEKKRERRINRLVTGSLCGQPYKLALLNAKLPKADRNPFTSYISASQRLSGFTKKSVQT